jgi:uncharacterized membrane protein YdcZ (DUF606 family)
MPTGITAYHADMRFSAVLIANAVAWAVLVGLIAVAFVLVEVWGPFGLVVLGLAVLLVCTSLSLHDDIPTGGTEVFRTRMAAHGSPEQRAAMLDEKRSRLSPLNFYRWCGVVLIVAGMSGFIGQQLR